MVFLTCTQNQHSSDTRTTEEERDFQSASESSFTECARSIHVIIILRL